MKKSKLLSEKNDTVTVGTKSYDSMWEDFERKFPKSEKPAGEGWKSLYEIAKKLRISVQTVKYHVGRGVREGRMEIFWGRTENGQRVRYVRPIIPRAN